MKLILSQKKINKKKNLIMKIKLQIMILPKKTQVKQENLLIKIHKKAPKKLRKKLEMLMKMQ